MRTEAVTRTMQVCLGEQAIPVGTLTYSRQGARENTLFFYDDAWLGNDNRFEISPDLPLTRERYFHKAATRSDSVFHFAIADTEPDGWGCKVIARDHAKRRKAGQASERAALTEMDYLLGVDDIGRMGALRFRNAAGEFIRTPQEGERGIPALLELTEIIDAAHAVERGTETEKDLAYLRGRATSLGGMRPKCTIVDEDGHLAIGKFPSVSDDRAVTKAEILALNLATAAGINAARGRIVHSDGIAVALIRRFDRVRTARIPYLSATSMLLASREEEHAYSEIAERILSVSPDATRDLAELWRRIVFNMLITNVDDHLNNHGFLHVGHGQWRLAPAFDLNPFPDKGRDPKTWLTEETGPTGKIEDALRAAPYFHLTDADALRILGEVFSAVSRWRQVAKDAAVGMTAVESEVFEPAFDHEETQSAKTRLAQ
jgi:serine/threonine-protein kinase HipA